MPLSHPTLPSRQISGSCFGPSHPSSPIPGPQFWGSSGERLCLNGLEPELTAPDRARQRLPLMFLILLLLMVTVQFITVTDHKQRITTHVIHIIKTPHLRIPAANFSPTRDLTLEISKYFHKSIIVSTFWADCSLEFGVD